MFPSTFLIVFSLLVYPVFAGHTLPILPFYSLKDLKDTASEDYVYGIDFTSRNYSERIGDRFESKVVRKSVYRLTRIVSMRLFFKGACFASQILPLKNPRSFQIFTVNGGLLCYKSSYLMYKNFDAMEYVCASPIRQYPNIRLMKNYLRIAPDLDELQRIQDEVVNKRYPKSSYQAFEAEGQEVQQFPLEILKDYRPGHLPFPYSTWPYRLVLKSLVLLLNELHSYIMGSDKMTLVQLLNALTSTSFRGSPFIYHHFDVPVKIVRLLKQPVDTLEPEEPVLIGTIDYGATKGKTVPYNGPKPLEPIKFSIPPSLGQKVILLHSLKEGEYYETNGRSAILMGMPVDMYRGSQETIVVTIPYVPRTGVRDDLLAMDRLSNIPIEFAPNLSTPTIEYADTEE